MSRVRRVSLTDNPLVACVAALLACLACSTMAATAGAAGSNTAEQATKESLQTFEKQLDADEIKSAEFRAKRHLLHVNLKDKRHYVVEASSSASLRNQLKAHGVSIAAVKSPGHKTRYIVGGAIVVVVIILAVGVLLLWRRRRGRGSGDFAEF